MVFYDVENFFDGFEVNREYTPVTLKTAKEAGAGRIVLCDTNGGNFPLSRHNVSRAALIDSIEYKPIDNTERRFKTYL